MFFTFYADSVQLSWRVRILRIEFPDEILFSFRSFGFNDDVGVFGGDAGFQFYLSFSGADTSGGFCVP